MKLIALVGPSNSGKTTTLKKLGDTLITEGGTIKWLKKGKRNYNEEKELSSIQNLMSIPGDLHVKISYNDKLVYINTFGDDVDRVKNGFDNAQDCEIYVFARHDTEHAKDFIEEFMRRNGIYTIYEVWKVGSMKKCENYPNFDKVTNCADCLAIQEILSQL